ncbi:MAG: ATP-binding cassette domain-containing protein [Planctomycetota bacterium]
MGDLDTSTQPAAELVGVTVRRGGTTILDGVDLALPAGRCTALLGANGCGKTTLSRALLGQVAVSAGEVRVLGETLGRTDVRRLRRRVGVVAPAVDPSGEMHVPGAVVDAELSATEAVCTGFFGTVGRYDRPGDGQIEAARATLDRVGLGHRRDAVFGRLSTGEQRRAVLARALVAGPELLILDEPTAGLDVLGRECMLATLDELLAGPRPPAVLLITHHVEELPAATHRVALMRDGHLHAVGPPDVVMTPEHLTATLGCPVYVQRRGSRYWLEVLPEARLSLLGGGGAGHVER